MKTAAPSVLPETPAQHDDPEFVTALARGFAILRCYRRGEHALGIKEFAARTGLPRSTVVRFTYTLTELGYLERLPGEHLYALGMAVVGFGQTYLGNLKLRQAARPAMQELAAEVHATVALAATSGEDMMFLELAHGNPDYVPSFAVGDRVPRGMAGLGRACAAGLPAPQRERFLEAVRRTIPTPDWPAALWGFHEALADYEVHGICLSLGAWNKDVFAVSVPLLARDPSKVTAFSVSMPSRLATRQHLISHVGPRLIRMRDRVASTLGSSW